MLGVGGVTPRQHGAHGLAAGTVVGHGGGGQSFPTASCTCAWRLPALPPVTLRVWRVGTSGSCLPPTCSVTWGKCFCFTGPVPPKGNSKGGSLGGSTRMGGQVAVGVCDPFLSQR